jgi:hypothetical protein
MNMSRGLRPSAPRGSGPLPCLASSPRPYGSGKASSRLPTEFSRSVRSIRCSAIILLGHQTEIGCGAGRSWAADGHALISIAVRGLACRRIVQRLVEPFFMAQLLCRGPIQTADKIS